MTKQQKIWEGTRTVLGSMIPLVWYVMTTGFCMAVGMYLRRMASSSQKFLQQSGNFYTFIGILLFWRILYKKCRKKKVSLWEEATIDFSKPDIRLSAVCLLLGMSAALFVSSFLTMIPLPSGIMNAYQADSGKIFTGNDRVLVILMLVVLSPLTEEVLFRGMMLNRLLKFYSDRNAVLISAGIFALCHVNPVWMLYSFFSGVLLAQIALKKDNILYSVFMHMGFNFPAVIAASVGANRGLKGSAAGIVLIVLYGVIGLASFKLLSDRLWKEERL